MCRIKIVGIRLFEDVQERCFSNIWRIYSCPLIKVSFLGENGLLHGSNLDNDQFHLRCKSKWLRARFLIINCGRKMETETVDHRLIGNIQVLWKKEVSNRTPYWLSFKTRGKRSRNLFNFIFLFFTSRFTTENLAPAMISLLTWFLNRLLCVTPEDILRSFT